MNNQNPLNEGQLHALINVSKTVNSHLDLDAVLRSIMAATTEMLQAEAASLVLADEDSDELVFHVATGEKAESLKAFRLRRGEGIVGHVIENQQSIIVSDAQSDPRFSPKVDHDTGFVTRSILCTPLTRGDAVLGAIEVLNRLDGDPFSAEDQSLCEAISGQAAVAIENAVLHRRLLRHERLAAVGQTVAGLAHCVRNVLNGIEGGTYMIDLGLSDGDEATIRHGWEIVRRKNAIIQDLVLDMLTYSKERTPDYEPVDINELVSSVIEVITAKESGRKISLVWNPVDDMPPVIVEPKGIRRCLFNLIGNALDASEGADVGKVEIRATAPANGEFSLEVVDAGCGIPDEDKPKLFEPFFSTKGAAGTGLGLAVTHKIVTEHGGRILVESAPGVGSRFRMILPARRAEKHQSENGLGAETPDTRMRPRSSPHPGTDGDSQPRCKRVLLVDDDPDIVSFLEASLWAFKDMEVYNAIDGDEGIAKALKLRPDLIILDLQMPRKDGFSTFKDLRANRATAQIPVIILTGSKETTGIRFSAADMGGYLGHAPDAYLEKPIFPAILQRKVAEVLGLSLH